MVKSTIDEIKDITLERQIRKLASVIDKQNEVVDNIGDVDSRITAVEDSTANNTVQINNLKQTVATNKLATDSAITALQNKDAEQDGTLTDHSTQIQNITKSLVSGVQIMPGTTTGEIKVRLERESATAIDSNNYNLGLPVSAEVIQGTGPSMFKIQITMSSGVKVVSNDFVFTTEAIGTDVYISSFTFKAGNQAGYLSADIGLNNGVVIEANNFLVPTDPNVTSAITDLQSRVSTIESTGVTGFNELKTTVEGHTTSINKLNTDVSRLNTKKADVNNNKQTITAKTINATNINKGSVAVATVNDIPDISGKVDIAQGTENAGKSLIVGNDGNVTIGSISGPSLFDCGPVLVSIPILKSLFSEPSSVGVYQLIFGINAVRNNSTSPSSLIKRFVGFNRDGSSISKNTHHMSYTSDIAIAIAEAIDLKQFGVHTYDVQLYSGIDSDMVGFMATLTIKWDGTSYSYTNLASNILITAPNSYSVAEYDNEHYLVAFAISDVIITA